MRPVRLDMDGFAAFRDQATVDFTDADFFALVGPTGSGKSTVIDAMTFALYGTVPRWRTGGWSCTRWRRPPTAARCGWSSTSTATVCRRPGIATGQERRRAPSKAPAWKGFSTPTAIGTINDLTDVMAADGLVTAEVEKLLGLPLRALLPVRGAAAGRVRGILAGQGF